jgi:hypothetical protein
MSFAAPPANRSNDGLQPVDVGPRERECIFDPFESQSPIWQGTLWRSAAERGHPSGCAALSVEFP